jgi:hypothetical protein
MTAGYKKIRKNSKLTLKFVFSAFNAISIYLFKVHNFKVVKSKKCTALVDVMVTILFFLVSANAKYSHAAYAQ